MIETFKVGTQNRRLLERLQEGPVYNHEIRNLGILNHSGRISDVRSRVRLLGWDVIGEQIVKGRWEYRLVPLSKPETPRRGLWDMIKGLMGGKS